MMPYLPVSQNSDAPVMRHATSLPAMYMQTQAVASGRPALATIAPMTSTISAWAVLMAELWRMASASGRWIVSSSSSGSWLWRSR